MKVIKAEVLGFCFGVRRAVELAQKELEESLNKNNVFSLGPLIHNEIALKKLSDQGLKIVEENNIASLPENSTVIIRAHGVCPDTIKKLENKGCKIVDATCPRVKASQKMVEKYSSQNDYIILTGDKNHGEVIGIAGYAGKNFIQIQDFYEAQKINIENSDSINVILLSQTTYSPQEFLKIQELFKTKFKNLAIMNTICPATEERQNALMNLCKLVEGVIVIGGKSSANTKRLYQTAEKNCKNAVHIQSAEEIPLEFFKFDTVGITAGTSTPDEVIQKVQERLVAGI